MYCSLPSCNGQRGQNPLPSCLSRGKPYPQIPIEPPNQIKGLIWKSDKGCNGQWGQWRQNPLPNFYSPFACRRPTSLISRCSTPPTHPSIILSPRVRSCWNQPHPQEREAAISRGDKLSRELIGYQPVSIRRQQCTVLSGVSHLVCD